MTEHEEIRVPPSQPATGYPIIGETTEGLGEHLVRSGKLKSLDDYQRIRRDALAIVKNSRRFSGTDGTLTGLAVGYVQSGKTLSMTCVSSLARDNGCRLVILLAGVTTNLLDQNAKRFRTDLRAASGKATAWRIFNSETLGDQDLQHLQQAVAEWKDPNYSENDRQTFLFMVLKNHAHLDKLYRLLSSVDLHGVPAVILDDEADQAGLNTAPDKPEASTTYRKIRLVRSALPHHTYLQYTATPQAPLLIALDDMLSPAFAELVEPGDGYTGGQAFFGVGARTGIIRPIPTEDQFKPGSPPDEPPASLLEAMRIFFVGCAVAAVRGNPTPCSMLVHPSQRVADHTRYLGWITEIMKRWATTLRGTDEDEKKDTLDEFHAGYADLAKTDDNLPTFDQLVPRLLVSLGRASLTQVNSQDGSEIDWDNADVHVLVGGEKLNRGFTVEGLTVTYMPRDAGGWNADTLQQRARFFGYKAGYLGLCRLYLHPDVIAAYRSYVVHEEDIRKQLANHRGRPLREWRRAFFLNANMRPTRRNVLSDPYYRVPMDRLWFVQRHPHDDQEAITRNTKLLRAFEKGHSFRKEGYFEHTVAEVSLKAFYEQVLVDYDLGGGGDVAGWYGHLVTIGDILERSPDAEMLLMKMHGDRARKEDGGAIVLHQGPSPSKTPGAYPGDAKMCDGTLVTVQIHTVDVKDGGPQGVPALAIHVPRALRKDDVMVKG